MVALTPLAALVSLGGGGSLAFLALNALAGMATARGKSAIWQARRRARETGISLYSPAGLALVIGCPPLMASD